MRIAYQRLVEVTKASVRQAQTLVDHLQGHADEHHAPLVEELETLLPKVEQVIDQTVRRVFEGESVPAAGETGQPL